MTAVTERAAVADAIGRIERRPAGFTTSFFATPEQIQRSIESNRLRSAVSEDAVLLLRRDRDFEHVSHVAADAASLAAALTELVANVDNSRTLVADLVGRTGELEAIAAAYHEHGFCDHATLLRMARPGVAPGEDRLDEPAATAGLEDMTAIAEFLARMLDPWRDQMPDDSEITAAIRQGTVLLERRETVVGGCLFFETTGLTSLLRYWYVDPDCRGQGVGARLFRTFFDRCRASRRLLVWVDARNAEAIAKYRHYGFEGDQLVDRILVRKGNAGHEND